MLAVLVIALCRGALVASQDEAINHTDVARSATNRVCYNDFGCFNTGYPWTSGRRTVPPPAPPSAIPVWFYYYTRPNVNQRYVVRAYPNVDMNGAPYDPYKPTVFICHGYLESGNSPWLRDMKDSYLSRRDANVFIVDWSTGATSNYYQSVSNARVTGRYIARTVNFLQQNYNANPADFHLIGHSLGGHVVSYAAKETPGIGRVTALDPAQPQFEGHDRRIRLDRSDAQFVDVIHTDAKPYTPFLGFGLMQPVGHVDFYMNGGYDQPGCEGPSNAYSYYTSFYTNTFRRTICDHQRSHRYLSEAFRRENQCTFWGHRAAPRQVSRQIPYTWASRSVTRYSSVTNACTVEDCIPMGFNTPLWNSRGTFVVNTSNRSPFCRPERGPLNSRGRRKDDVEDGFGVVNGTNEEVPHVLDEPSTSEMHPL